jgi:hypothetical protein
MTLTLDTPIWLDNDVATFVKVDMDNSATSVFNLFGARANYTLRM